MFKANDLPPVEIDINENVTQKNNKNVHIVQICMYTNKTKFAGVNM